MRVCDPRLSPEVLKVALPEASSVTGGFWAVPSMVNVTEPLGAGPPETWLLTVAVKVTVWPNPEGLNDDVRAVLVASWLTV